MPDPQSHNLSRHQWKRKKKLNWRDSETVDQEGHEDEGRRRYTVVAGEPAVANGRFPIMREDHWQQVLEVLHVWQSNLGQTHHEELPPLPIIFLSVENNVGSGLSFSYFI